MGQAQTHLESKVFDDAAPPWDLKEVTAHTELSEDFVNSCWRMWVQHPKVKKGHLREQDFYQLLNFADEDTEEAIEQTSDKRRAKRLFELLDREDDDRLEFPDLMMFLFTTSEDMTQEQKLKRSFRLCDLNQSGKISKEEMVDVLDKLEVLDMEHDDKGKVIIPDHVENLFSLMDFAHDKKISEEEFLKATMHYRKLGQMMTISLMEKRRKHLLQEVKEFIAKEMKEEKKVKDTGGTDKDPKTANKSGGGFFKSLSKSRLKDSKDSSGSSLEKEEKAIAPDVSDNK